MFRPVQSHVSFPALEADILKFWKEAKTYERSLEHRAGAPKFVFYEGPPTANGLPHPGHCLTRAIKDLYPRYRTMRGYLCQRKAGWDTHGLPVEVEVCKELGIHSKEDIENYGVEPFIHKCQQSVWRYMQEWENLTERIGFWIDLGDAYVTYHQSYIESVWASLKELFNRGLLYQGHKIVWWWAQGGTALSAGEVGLGYREVADPSVYVLFPLLDKDGNPLETSLLVWTTTPWTLPSNQFVAVHPDLTYVIVDFFRERDATAQMRQSSSKSAGKSHSWSETASGAYQQSLDGHEERTRVIVAKDLVAALADKFGAVAYRISDEMAGGDLVSRGYRYLPPFPESYYEKKSPIPGMSPSAPDHPAGTIAPKKNLNEPLTWGQTRVMKAKAIERNGDSVKRLMAGSFPEYIGWRVVAAPFVTTDSGTGVVHLAPAFGEADLAIWKEENESFFAPLPILIPVAPNGNFTDEAPEYCRGRWVKKCDKEITRDIKQRGLLYYQEQYVHEYPFCWRAEEDPLIQYPRESWFIRTTSFKDEMLKNNRQINWMPEHIRDGRMGKFLESNVDWALSRERYWGTPLPIWICEATGIAEAIGSYEELLAKPDVQGTDIWTAAKQKNPELVDDLKVHKPYIDAVTYASTQPGVPPGTRMRRVPDVIDCWYDSGAMPFAQWGYPHQGREKFKDQFPADFISEALDQTRGWFYSQLAIATLLFRDQDSKSSDWPCKGLPMPFRNCIVLGLMLGEDGQKMSKQKRNYRQPQEIFDLYGADALRWYFFANQPPWTSIRYSERAIKESIPEFLLRLWHVYSFFVIYATIDGFDPAAELPGDAGELEPPVLARGRKFPPIGLRSELDRWILSELHRTAAEVTARMDEYDNYAACQRLTEFVDALSNWYVRRSRDRFWAADKTSPAKHEAYWTLYQCLLITSKLVAPFVPFVAEAIWQNLAVAAFGRRVVESVHLCDYPIGDERVIDALLSERMNLVREIASLGRAARMGAKLKVRQPLAKVEVILADKTHLGWLTEHCDLLQEELNVKAVEFSDRAEQYITYSLLPDLKRLGPRLGKRLPALKTALAAASADKIRAELESPGQVTFDLPDGPVTLDREDLQVRLQAKPGWSAAQGHAGVVVLSTDLTPDLLAEGLARELIHAISARRKEMDLGYTDRIRVGLVTDSPELSRAAKQFLEAIQSETLCTELCFEPLAEVEPQEITVAEHQAYLHISLMI